MTNTRHGVSVAEHIGLTGTSEKNGLGAAISEATGFEITNAKNYSPDVGWKAADTDPANTRALETLSASKPISAFVIAVDGMDGPDDAIRARWDGGIGAGGGLVEKPSAALVEGTSTDQNIAETADWSWIVFGRANPLQLLEDSAIAEIRTTGASSDTTRLIQLLIGDSGQLRVNLPRMSGSADVVDTTGQIDDVDTPYWIEVHFTDDGGSGGNASILLNGVQVGTLATTVTFASQPATGVRLVSSGKHYLGGMWFFKDVLAAAQATLYRYSLRAGTELHLEAALNLEETTGLTGADATGNSNTMTFASDPGWATITNPRPDHNPEPAARHQPWLERNAYSAFTSGATTPAELDASPVVSAWFWYRSRGGATAFSPNFCYFGTATTAGNFDWLIQERGTGNLRLTVDRFSGGSVTADTGDVNDGGLYAITLRIAWGTASIGVDGVEVNSVGSVPAFTASAIAKFVLSAATTHSGHIGGPVGIAQRPHTHAEMYDFLTGAAQVIPSPSTSPAQALLWPFTEGTGTTAANFGSDAGGDLTVTSADWRVDALKNPAPGPLRDPTQKLNLVWLEIAPGTSPLCGQFLLEMFTTEAAAPIVYAIMVFEVVWPTHGFASGSESPHGPRVARGAGGGTFPGASIPGRTASYRVSNETLEEFPELRMAVARSSQIWRAGALVEATPTLMVDRVPDRNHWFETCIVGQAQQPVTTLLGPQAGESLRRGVAISVIEIFVKE